MSQVRQLQLLDAERSMADWAPDPDGEHGEVFTRRWVVELILDLVGYDPEERIFEKVILEPSCGWGAFLLPIVERLVESCRLHGHKVDACSHSIRALDLLERNTERARKDVMAKLVELGEAVEVAERLSGEWVTTADFLLSNHDPGTADFVVGNPPYIRLEDIPARVSDAYRRECSTMRGRADIYVGFYEKGLSLLAAEGRLGFICADRWMRNQYGARLRQFVTSSYSVDSVVVMHDVDAFEDDVSAYPAITILRNGIQGTAKVVEANAAFDETAADSVSGWSVRKEPLPHSTAFEGAELPAWFDGEGLWPSGSPGELELIAELEERFGPLEDPNTGTRVGIGVATGCDEVYITCDAPSVESERLLPLLTAADIADGSPNWSGKYLVNPWDEDGLVDVDVYPGLAGYFSDHEERLRQRHVAKKQPAKWYRTIDRVTPGLLERPKLLLPDMKAAAHPVLDPGGHYPHHNLYYVVSDEWDLEVLGGILLSEIANLFVGAYCVKMRGGTYRFQAQYLRKIRVPDPRAVSPRVESALRDAFRARDKDQATNAACELYGVSGLVDV